VVVVVLTCLVGNGTALAEGGWRVFSLGAARRGHTATLKGDRVLLIGGSSCKPNDQLEAGRTAEVFDAGSGKSAPLPDLKTPRLDHTATMLRDGRIVVVGGRSSSLDWAEVTPSVEVLSEDRGVWRWTAGPPLKHHRYGHAAVLLRDGRVLVIGGFEKKKGAELRSTELWDGGPGGWIEGPALPSVESDIVAHGPRAHVLKDGRVVVVDASGVPALLNARATGWSRMVSTPLFNEESGHNEVNSVQLADGALILVGRENHRMQRPHEYPVFRLPKSGGRWTQVASLEATLSLGSMVATTSDVMSLTGKRLAALSTATWTWRPIEPPPFFHQGEALTALRDGRLVVSGGQEETCQLVEVWDPKITPPGRWSTWTPRTKDPSAGAIVTSRDGSVLMQTQDGTRLWDPTSDAVGPPAPMNAKRINESYVLLADGRLLAAGGLDPTKSIGEHLSRKKLPPQIAPDVLASTEIFDVKQRAWSKGPPLLESQSGGIGVVLRSGEVMLLGGRAELFESQIDMYGFLYTSHTLYRRPEHWAPGATAWRLGTAPPFSGASYPAAVALADGRALVTNDHQAAVYDPNRSSWTATGAPRQPGSGGATVLLPDGRVLLVGGYEQTPPPNPHERALSRVEAWSASTGAWSDVAPTEVPRGRPGAVVLPDGRVLVTGETSNGRRVRPELWDSKTNSWTLVASPPDENVLGRPLLLKDGRVLLGAEVLSP
jgi:hypothetical protein